MPFHPRETEIQSDKSNKVRRVFFLRGNGSPALLLITDFNYLICGAGPRVIFTGPRGSPGTRLTGVSQMPIMKMKPGKEFLCSAAFSRAK